MSYKNFRGHIEEMEPNRYATFGEVSVLDEEQVEITELPVKTWTQGNHNREKDSKKQARRQRSIGDVKVKRIYSDGELKEIPFTNQIHIAYFVSILTRLTMEAIFIYTGYGIFKFVDNTSSQVKSGFHVDFIWFHVPALYTCIANTAEIKLACHQSFGMSNDINNHVPCWVSKPWEKTIFIRYMNVLSAICLLLCVMELIYLTVRWLTRCLRKRHSQKNHPLNRHDSGAYVTALSTHHNMENETRYPTWQHRFREQV